MNRHDFEQAARQFRAGKLTLADFSKQVVPALQASGSSRNRQATSDTAAAESSTPSSSLAPAPSRGQALDLDLDRAQRCGFPEVIYGPGKSWEVLVEAVQRLADAKQPVLVTRLEHDRGERLQGQFPSGHHNPIARTFRWVTDDSERQGSVAVVTAGTGDLPVAEEAAETLAWMGVSAQIIADVGVAGPSRLAKWLPELRRQDVVVVAAGCEGALPSVVAGHLSCPIIAVPTSVGYGANLGGVASLLSMLNSCAASVAVVNIDAGFKAGFLAGMISLRNRSQR